MTMENAITIIELYKQRLTNSASNQLSEDIAAFDLALQAMRDYRPAGKWVPDSKKNWVLRCSVCNKEAIFDDYEGEYRRSSYCSCCGAKME